MASKNDCQSKCSRALGLYIHDIQYKQATTIEWSFPIWVIYCVCAQCIHIQCERQSYVAIFLINFKIFRILEFKIFLKSHFILPFVLLLSFSLLFMLSFIEKQTLYKSKIDDQPNELHNSHALRFTWNWMHTKIDNRTSQFRIMTVSNLCRLLHTLNNSACSLI